MKRALSFSDTESKSDDFTACLNVFNDKISDQNWDFLPLSED